MIWSLGVPPLWGGRGAEIAANSFHQVAQLTLVVARIGYKMNHLATHFLPSEVRVLKFRVADVCAKYGKDIGTRGSCMSFEA